MAYEDEEPTSEELLAYLNQGQSSNTPYYALPPEQMSSKNAPPPPPQMKGDEMPIVKKKMVPAPVPVSDDESMDEPYKPFSFNGDELADKEKAYQQANAARLSTMKALDNLQNIPTAGAMRFGLNTGPNADNAGVELQAQKNQMSPMERQQAILKQYQGARGMYEDQASHDVNSPESKQAFNNLYNSLMQVSPKLADSLQPMSKVQIDEAVKEGMLGKIVGGEYALRGKQAMADIMKQGLALRTTTGENRIFNAVDQNKIIAPAKQQIANADIALDVLSRPITPEQYADVQAKYNAVLAQGASHAASLEHGRNLTPFYNDAVKLKEKITNHPEMLNSPAIVAQMTKALTDLRNANQANINLETKHLRNRGYSDPTTNAAYQKYLDDFSNSGNSPMPQQAATVVMRNMSTGQTGDMPADQVDAAIKSGKFSKVQ